jgi:hypothetical protein
MPTQDYPTQLIALVGEALSAVGPTLFGNPAEGEHGAPRRFVWIPRQSPIGGPKHVGGRPTHVDSVALTFSVQCWGHGYDDAFWMACALITALRRELKGRNYEAASLDPTQGELRHEGFVMAVQVALLLDLPAVDLTTPPAAPTPAPAPSAGGAGSSGMSEPVPDPTTPAYGSTDTTSALVTTVAEATPATSTSGDGVLEGTET